MQLEEPDSIAEFGLRRDDPTLRKIQGLDNVVFGRRGEASLMMDCGETER
jgi:hypothetical protein